MKLYGSLRELVAAVFRKDTKDIELRPNSSSYSGVTSPVVELPPPSSGTVELVDKTSSQTLSGKSISGSTNTLSNIPNNATTAASANTPSAIVARDGSGDFSAGTITADLVGNASTATSATSATSFTGSLSGEVTGTQSATVVADNVIDNDNIKSTAAIAYSKLALTGSILNADLAGSIDAAKISSGSVSNTEFDYLNGVTSSIQTQFSGKAASGANSDITSLSGLTTALSISQGGTGQTSASAAINALLPSQSANFNKYLKTDGTNVSWASASGGAGEINAILNSSGADGVTGWAFDGTHSITNVTGATLPLSPAVTTAFSIQSSAAVALGSQTNASGDYYEFTMPPGLRNRKLKFEFFFNTPAASAGTWGVAVYNGSTKVALSTDSGGDTILPAGVSGGKFTAYFDTDAGTTYRVNFVQRTRTTTNALYVANVVVGPGIQPQGAVVGEWTSFTPTLNSTTNVSKNNARYRRVGSVMHLSGTIEWNGAGAAGNLTIGLGGFTIDTSQLNSAAVPYLGSGELFNTTNYTTLAVVQDTGTATSIKLINTGTGVFYASSSSVSGYRIDYTAQIPIAEWAGSGTVQLAQNDVEYAANNGPTWNAANTTDFTTNILGPAGAQLGGALTGSTFKRVRFQTPIQPGDRIEVELSTDRKLWQAANGSRIGASGIPVIASLNTAGNTFSGLFWQSVSGSSTDVDVLFGINASGATDDSPTNAWPSDAYWRVRKSSAGAAVGFGIVQPGVSSGLVSAAGLPGNTTGNAIASGYVGQEIKSISTSAVTVNSTPTPNTWYDIPGLSVTLTAGVWDMSGASSFTMATNSATWGNVLVGFQFAIRDVANNIIVYAFNSGPGSPLWGTRMFFSLPPTRVVALNDTTYKLSIQPRDDYGSTSYGALLARGDLGTLVIRANRVG